MSVLVQSLINNHHHSHAAYFANHSTRRLHGNAAQTKAARQATAKVNETEQTNDHVPHGVVNSMKQRLLDKVNESLLSNNNNNNNSGTLVGRFPLTKPASNENLLQVRSAYPSLKHATRLSRSQDNLTHHLTGNEPFTSYIQPKQDVIIVESTTTTTTIDSEHDEDIGQKYALHRQSYTELLVDEAPKPGTVTTVKNMFERQIRLSRYDADKLLGASTPASSRVSSQHREAGSPVRSRSASPNDVVLRQRRANISAPPLPLTSTTLLLATATSYPDLVISHTPPTEATKSAPEPVSHDPVAQGSTKEKRISIPIRHSAPLEQIPLSVIVAEESSSSPTDQYRSNLLLPFTVSSSPEAVDCQPLDFKSRLALFNRTNTQKSNDSSVVMRKPASSSHLPAVHVVGKPPVHQSTRMVHEEKHVAPDEPTHHQLLPSISRSVVNTAKAVTFFGGARVNGSAKSSLPAGISAPPPPNASKSEPPATSTSPDLAQVPDVIGGDVKLTKSSIFSGTRKDARVQFIDSVDIFEYLSFEVAMAEIGSAGSDNDNDMNNDDDDDDVDDDSPHKPNGKPDESTAKTDYSRRTNDDELEQLARINATYNVNPSAEKPLKPKGTLHTFRPTHLDQYELGMQHGSLSSTKPSDTSSSTISYSILARQKLLPTSDIPTKSIPNHPLLKYAQRPMFDMANNIQWSSMSTTTDLLF